MSPSPTVISVGAVDRRRSPPSAVVAEHASAWSQNASALCGWGFDSTCRSSSTNSSGALVEEARREHPEPDLARQLEQRRRRVRSPASCGSARSCSGRPATSVQWRAASERAGWRTPICCAISPPIEAPTTCARSIPRKRAAGGDVGEQRRSCTGRAAPPSGRHPGCRRRSRGSDSLQRLGLQAPRSCGRRRDR